MSNKIIFKELKNHEVNRMLSNDNVDYNLLNFFIDIVLCNLNFMDRTYVWDNNFKPDIVDLDNHYNYCITHIMTDLENNGVSFIKKDRLKKSLYKAIYSLYYEYSSDDKQYIVSFLNKTLNVESIRTIEDYNLIIGIYNIFNDHFKK